MYRDISFLLNSTTHVEVTPNVNVILDLPSYVHFHILAQLVTEWSPIGK